MCIPVYKVHSLTHVTSFAQYGGILWSIFDANITHNTLFGANIFCLSMTVYIRYMSRNTYVMRFVLHLKTPSSIGRNRGGVRVLTTRIPQSYVASAAVVAIQHVQSARLTPTGNLERSGGVRHFPTVIFES